MKYLLFFLILIVGFTIVNVPYSDAIWVKKDAEALWKDSESVFIGTVLDRQEATNHDDQGNPIIKDIYTVKVENYFKNHLGKDTVKVYSPVKNGKILGGFQVGDRVLFYLDAGWGANTYAPESCLIESDCTGGQISQIFSRDAVTTSNILQNVLVGISIVGVGGIAFWIWRKRK